MYITIVLWGIIHSFVNFKPLFTLYFFGLNFHDWHNACYWYMIGHSFFLSEIALPWFGTKYSQSFVIHLTIQFHPTFSCLMALDGLYWYLLFDYGSFLGNFWWCSSKPVAQGKLMSKRSLMMDTAASLWNLEMIMFGQICHALVALFSSSCK